MFKSAFFGVICSFPGVALQWVNVSFTFHQKYLVVTLSTPGKLSCQHQDAVQRARRARAKNSSQKWLRGQDSYQRNRVLQTPWWYILKGRTVQLPQKYCCEFWIFRQFYHIPLKINGWNTIVKVWFRCFCSFSNRWCSCSMLSFQGVSQHTASSLVFKKTSPSQLTAGTPKNWWVCRYFFFFLSGVCVKTGRIFWVPEFWKPTNLAHYRQAAKMFGIPWRIHGTIIYLPTWKP